LITIGPSHSGQTKTGSCLIDFSLTKPLFSGTNTKAPNKIQASSYKAVHYIGGSSAMYGVPEDLAIQTLVMDIYEKHNGIVSSVCHGTAGIAFLKLKSGKHLVSGKGISGYPDEYENLNKAYSKQCRLKLPKL
jgi:putative intracellular protease/amidase